MIGGCASRKGQVAAALSWFTHIMRWVLMTPLGCPVEPDVNRILGLGSGPTRAKAWATSALGAQAVRLENAVRDTPGSAPRLATISPRVAPMALSALASCSASST